MNDLVKRLRRYSCQSDDPTDPVEELIKDLHDAADRIEELKAENKRLRDILSDPLELRKYVNRKLEEEAALEDSDE
jgi:cell shape-determining protein MreC